MDKREHTQKKKKKKCRIFKRCTFNSRKTAVRRFRAINVISVHNHGQRGEGGGCRRRGVRLIRGRRQQEHSELSSQSLFIFIIMDMTGKRLTFHSATTAATFATIFCNLRL